MARQQYRLVQQLGEGGMGRVHLGYPTKNPNSQKLRALKQIKSDLLREPTIKERFLREATVALSLNHPNIIKTEDLKSAKTADQEDYYLVMEHIKGLELHHLCGRLSLPASVRIMIALLKALDHLRERRIVHRDISPDNILIGFNGAIKLMDFGIAISDELDRCTKRGVRLGKCAYMAPEQTRAEPVDHRSDLYTLGCVFFELLTGEPLYPSVDDLIDLFSDIEKTPAKPLFSVRPSIPQTLSDFVLRLLEKDPNDRYQTARSALEALAGIAAPSDAATLQREVATISTEEGLQQDETWLDQKIQTLELDHVDLGFDETLLNPIGTPTVLDDQRKTEPIVALDVPQLLPIPKIIPPSSLSAPERPIAAEPLARPSISSRSLMTPQRQTNVAISLLMIVSCLLVAIAVTRSQRSEASVQITPASTPYAMPALTSAAEEASRAP